MFPFFWAAEISRISKVSMSIWHNSNQDAQRFQCPSRILYPTRVTSAGDLHRFQTSIFLFQHGKKHLSTIPTQSSMSRLKEQKSKAGSMTGEDGYKKMATVGKQNPRREAFHGHLTWSPLTWHALFLEVPRPLNVFLPMQGKINL